MIKYKTCDECNGIFQLNTDNFFISRINQDGFTDICKNCMHKRSEIMQNGNKRRNTHKGAITHYSEYMSAYQITQCKK